MVYITCTMISSVDLARYGLSRAKYLGTHVSRDCGTKDSNSIVIFLKYIFRSLFFYFQVGWN